MKLIQKMVGMARSGASVAKVLVERKLRERREPSSPPKPIPKGEERDYTLDELAAFDGTDPEKPVLLAIKGRVYDVTRGRDFYGKGGPYGIFAGKDCSRALAKLSFEPEDCVGDLSGLDEWELEKLEDWVDTFQMKYPELGTLVD